MYTRFNISCHGIADPVFQFLLFSGIPTGYVLQIAGNPANLDDIMGTALRAYCRVTEWAVLNTRDDLVSAMAMIEGTHDREMVVSASRTWRRVHDKVAGMTFVSSSFGRDILKMPVPFRNLLLFSAPLHTTTMNGIVLNLEDDEDSASVDS